MNALPDSILKVVNVHVEAPLIRCEDEMVILDATQTFDATYQWNNGGTNYMVELNQSGLYIVTVSTACQSDEASVNVIVEKCGEIVNVSPYIPNVFSPKEAMSSDLEGKKEKRYKGDVTTIK